MSPKAKRPVRELYETATTWHWNFPAFAVARWPTRCRSSASAHLAVKESWLKRDGVIIFRPAPVKLTEKLKLNSPSPTHPVQMYTFPINLVLFAQIPSRGEPIICPDGALLAKSKKLSSAFVLFVPCSKFRLNSRGEVALPLYVY